jgi:hypothetical protein
MTSPSPQKVDLTILQVVSRRNFGPVRLPISYRGSLASAIRVFLIFFIEIPYFPWVGGTQVERAKKIAISCRWVGARG